MNKLYGTIQGIHSSGYMSIVDIDVMGVSFQSIVLETSESYSLLKPGNNIHVLFKETEVIIGRNDLSSLSIYNRISVTITSIEKGDLLTRLLLAREKIELSAAITTESFVRLALSVSDEVVAMINATEIMLAE